MVYKTVYTEVEVDVDIEDFDTEDLVDELERRGELPVEESGNAKDIVEKMYYLHRQGQDCDHLLDSLFYAVMGRIV
jgi:hypothetical protein